MTTDLRASNNELFHARWFCVGICWCKFLVHLDKCNKGKVKLSAFLAGTFLRNYNYLWVNKKVKKLKDLIVRSPFVYWLFWSSHCDNADRWHTFSNEKFVGPFDREIGENGQSQSVSFVNFYSQIESIRSKTSSTVYPSKNSSGRERKLAKFVYVDNWLDTLLLRRNYRGITAKKVNIDYYISKVIQSRTRTSQVIGFDGSIISF